MQNHASFAALTLYDAAGRLECASAGALLPKNARGQGWFAHARVPHDAYEIGHLAMVTDKMADTIEADRAELKTLGARQQLLLHELNHRIINNLELVLSIASQIARIHKTIGSFSEAFTARLKALAASHGLLIQRQWQGVSLRELADRRIAPHRADCSRTVAIEGADVELSPAAGLTLSLALHALATNATKYGALSSPNGTVAISWTLENGPRGRRVRLAWRESGGPPVSPPEQRGFGIGMIESAIAYQLEGESKIDFLPGGVVCDTVLPLNPAS